MERVARIVVDAVAVRGDGPGLRRGVELAAELLLTNLAYQILINLFRKHHE
jgi:hypothetical protein